MSGPTIATAKGPSFFSGAGLAEDIETIGTDLWNHEWVGAGLAVIPGGIDLLVTASDPLGALIAAGLGWVMDHLNPPKRWLDELAGNPGQVEANGETCGNVATWLRQEADEVERLAKVLASSMTGDALASYLKRIGEMTSTMRAQATSMDGLKESLLAASSVVLIVRSLVRDAISQIVASILSYVAELVISLGTATPLVIEQASAKVASWTSKLSGKVKELIAAHEALSKILAKIGVIWRKLGAAGKLINGEDFMRQGFAPGVAMHILPPDSAKELLRRLAENAGPLARQSAKDYLLKLAITHPQTLIIDGMSGAHASANRDY